MMAQITDDEVEERKERLNRIATATQVFGLLVLGIGLALVAPWLGVASIGAGCVAIGISLENS